LNLRRGREPPSDPQARRPRTDRPSPRARPRGHRHGRVPGLGRRPPPV